MIFSSQIKLYAAITLFVFLSSMVGYGVHLYNENKLLKFQTYELQQNTVATRDSLTKMAGVAQTLAIHVEELNKDKVQLKHSYTILQTDYQTLLDTLEQQGKGTVTVVGDSLILTFSGHDKFAYYSGRTAISTITKQGTWNVSIGFDTIKTKSSVFLDKTDNTWKIQTIAITDGVQLRGLAVIDEQTLEQIKGVPEITEEKYRSTLSIGVNVPLDFTSAFASLQYKYHNLGFSLGYKIFNKPVFSIKPASTDRIMLGISYYIF